MDDKAFYQSILTSFTLLFLITTAIWYVTIAFIKWDIVWIDMLSDMSMQMRSYFFLGIIGKIVIDFWIWSYIKVYYLDKDLDGEATAEKAEQDKLKNKFDNPETYD